MEFIVDQATLIGHQNWIGKFSWELDTFAYSIICKCFSTSIGKHLSSVTVIPKDI